MTAELAVDALRNAVALRGPVGTIVHSDRGSQFRSHAYVRALRDAQLRGSMGRVGACADNAAMESFFSPAAEERPEPAALGDPRRAAAGDRHLDREDLPPPPTPTPSADSPRSNSRHSPTPLSGLTPNSTSQPKSGQSPGSAFRRCWSPGPGLSD